MHHCISKMIFDLGIIVLILLNSVQGEIYDEVGRDEGDWSYEGENGPEKWGEKYPQCNGERQSPIRLEQGIKTEMERFVFTGYDIERSGLILTNNGHTVQVQLAADDTNPAYIEGGGLGARYDFAQFHFHWGLTDENGTEHEIAKKCGRRIMEVHFVHTNPEEEASIAVLGALFKPSMSIGFIDGTNKKYEPLTNALKEVAYKGQSSVLKESVKLSDFLPCKAERSKFYRYEGSLTTPPCSEGVIWTVFDAPLNIGRDQMETFRNTFSTTEDVQPGKKMAPNFRPIQNPNGRDIYKVCPKQQL